MSITLTDAASASLNVNAWNWGVLHDTLRCCTPQLLHDDHVLAQLRFGGVALDALDVAAIHRYLRAVVLPRIKPGERMLYDLTVTDTLDDGTFYRDDLRKNYSLRHDVVLEVIDFFEHATPPILVS